MPDSYIKEITHLSDKLGQSLKFNTQLIKALDLSNEGIAILNADGKYIWLNQAHEKMFGYEHKELVGQSWEVLYPQSYREYIKNKVFPILEKNKKWKGETTGILKDGKTPVKQMVYLTALDCGGLVCTCIKNDI